MGVFDFGFSFAASWLGLIDGLVCESLFACFKGSGCFAADVQVGGCFVVLALYYVNLFLGSCGLVVGLFEDCVGMRLFRCLWDGCFVLASLGKLVYVLGLGIVIYSTCGCRFDC